MIIITGGCGFIGSNIARRLNASGRRDILIVDHLENGRKISNISDLDIYDYMEGDHFIDLINTDKDLGKIDAIFHQGAISATTEWNGRLVMTNNYEYSKSLLHWCQARKTSFLYASSASVYGMGENGFREDRSCEHPINMYAYSKFQFDQYVRRHLAAIESQVVGLRYFNVYGPGEAHKGSMASTAFHFSNQVRDTNVARLFEGTDGYANGAQERDFVYVGDCVNVNMWFYENPDKSGIFNCGSGRAQSFNDMADAVIGWHGQGHKEYIPFPEHLKGSYQSYTCADLTNLRAIGYDAPFRSVQDGVNAYMDQRFGHPGTA